MPDTGAEAALALARELLGALMDTRIPDEERPEADGARQRGRGHRPRRRRHGACHHRRCRYAHVRGEGGRERAGKGRALTRLYRLRKTRWAWVNGYKSIPQRLKPINFAGFDWHD